MTPKSELDKKRWLNEELVFAFPKGLPGFEHLREYKLQEHNELFSILSAVEEETVTFITVNPFDFVPDYEFELSSDALADIGIIDREQIAVRCIVTWHSNKEKITVNLLAPLIFNVEKSIGKQIVLQNTDYTTRSTLWQKLRHKEQGGES
ncbi:MULTISPECIES: flagellar assembly protein FliW [Paenibacillus]|uniref:flagellar assembly protein FliW n=1 Tax=Paenibacillus TaxID=44249 RepID=UPI000C9F09B0|nr:MULTISPECIES: flagellar assembly protein FliW [Paenibacillus]MDY7991554.1 flagellar assembly protein FliW [Paenibacillus polymyxa]MDY8117995.1 flagellar assembly protein FliW [Paenibacillus polymyxa]PNQ82556.1 flagellar assembly protein FliW [Paenibacillus sp. F4]